MDRKNAIQDAYRLTGGNSFYDGMITCSTPAGKAVCRLVFLPQSREKMSIQLSGAVKRGKMG